MVVKVRIKIRTKAGSTSVPAVLNTGFESEEPELVLPLELAVELGVWPSGEVEYADYTTAGGSTSLPVVKKAARVELLLEDQKTKPMICNAVIDPNVDEVLLSDSAIDELGIIILSAKGKWRFRDDPEGKVRKSVG